MIAAIAVLCLLGLAAIVYGVRTARADRRYMAWASDETDWSRRAKQPAKDVGQ